MNLIKKILLLYFILLLTSCVNYKNSKTTQIEEKKYYSLNGFALVYQDDFYDQGIVNKRLNNEEMIAMHSVLNKNTFVKIINPETLKSVEIKIFRKASYPKIFNVLISQKIAEILELDINNPYVEVYEVKKNKTFIAKKSSIFDEEKKVADTAPVDEIKIDDLNKLKPEVKKMVNKKNNFVIVINDFYYNDSANNLKNELIEKTQINNFSVKKINNNKYRLSVGPFKNFNTLKSAYISLNNLGFEDLDVNRE